MYALDLILPWWALSGAAVCVLNLVRNPMSTGLALIVAVEAVGLVIVGMLHESVNG